MGFDDLGLRVLDTGDSLYNPDFLDANKLAFTNVCFLTRHPIPFVMFLMLGNFAVYSKEVKYTDYTDLGSLSEEEKIHLHAKYHGNHMVYPGRYFIDLNLPTQINPITFGEHFIDHRLIRLCIANKYMLTQEPDGSVSANIKFIPDFIVDYFTHAIAQFKCVSINAYDWTKYGLTFNGDINSHIHKFSFIRKKENAIIDPDFERNNQRGMLLRARQRLQDQLEANGDIANLELLRPDNMENVLEQIHRMLAMGAQVQQNIQRQEYPQDYPFMHVNILDDDNDSSNDDDSNDTNDDDDSNGSNDDNNDTNDN
jgi:hypothetical protein